ncbi:MAG: plasmid mobilization relaxosome protein MobC [Acetobacteraceae bacterium]|nr:plasmid mobilization relaxosome protein MobC [Acetobacteraceae bacterium]
MARHKRTDNGERMTAFVGFYVTRPRVRRAQADAARQGASISDYARELLLRRSGTPATVAGARRDPQTIAIVRALDHAAFEASALGNNLNQLARHANTTGELGPMRVAELEDLIELIRKAAENHIAALDPGARAGRARPRGRGGMNVRIVVAKGSLEPCAIASAKAAIR